MLTLSLLRHAKSNWDDPLADDFDRGLAARGLKAAPRMAKAMATYGIAPDLILCSTAARTRATLMLMLPHLAPPLPTLEHEEELYLAPVTRLKTRVSQLPATCRHALILGHNPGLHGLALELTGSGERADLEALATGFPTAALAVLTFEAQSWRDLKPASGHLAHFLTPRGLKGGLRD